MFDLSLLWMKPNVAYMTKHYQICFIFTLIRFCEHHDLLQMKLLIPYLAQVIDSFIIDATFYHTLKIVAHFPEGIGIKLPPFHPPPSMLALLLICLRKMQLIYLAQIFGKQLNCELILRQRGIANDV